MKIQSVDPKEIERQRELGWPDMHPEDFCHRCGVRNPNWYASQEDWLDATMKWAEETGREGICCPFCFLQMFEEAVGERVILEVKPHLIKRLPPFKII